MLYSVIIMMIYHQEAFSTQLKLTSIMNDARDVMNLVCSISQHYKHQLYTGEVNCTK